jgi:hypothetical protein
MSKYLLKAIPVMSERNLDIRLANTITNCQKVKAGYHVTFGVDEGTGTAIMNKLVTNEDNYRVFMMAVNSQQLTAVAKELEEADKKDVVLRVEDVLYNKTVRQLAREMGDAVTPETGPSAGDYMRAIMAIKFAAEQVKKALWAENITTENILPYLKEKGLIPDSENEAHQTIF